MFLGQQEKKKKKKDPQVTYDKERQLQSLGGRGKLLGLFTGKGVAKSLANEHIMEEVPCLRQC